MKIIIVGNGKVGYAIARQLAVEDHDITIVDDDAAALHRADSTLDVMCVEGNGASISVLDTAGVRSADLVIAVTNLDETNLVCCLIAKKLGAKHTIARVRNPEYRRDDTMLKREIGLDMLINPDLGAAQEIARILSFPAAFSVEPFAGGRIDMIGFQVTEQDTLAGVSLNDFHRNRLAEVLICAAHRGDNFIIPDGSFVPRSGDKLYMVGTKAELQKMLRGIGRTLQRVKNVSILGGSRITMYLTWELARSNTKVRIVEMKHDKCLRLSASLPGAMIIEGDGTDADLIDSENIFETDAFVALTDRDEENLLMALTAQRAGVPKVLAKMTRPNYMDLVQETKLGSIISPKDLTSNQITRYVRALANSQGSTVESLYKMLDGSVEALEFTATASSRSVLDKPLKDLALKKGVLLAAIARENKIIIPGGLTTIQEGDHVVVVTKTTGNIIVLAKDHYLMKRATLPISAMKHQAKAACIQCKMCTDLCPRYLIGHNIRPNLVMRNVWREEEIESNEEFKACFGEAVNCCDCGVCEMFACPMGLSPRKINSYMKGKLRERGIQVERQMEPHAREGLDYHRTPTERLVTRLGLSEYYHLHAHECFELCPNEVYIPFQQHIGKPAVPAKSAGDTVTRGELLAAAAEGLSANIHASMDGTVVSIDEKGAVIRGKEE